MRKRLAKPIPKLNARDERRLLAKIEFTDFCWNWKGPFETLGYGDFHYCGKNYKAHRVCYEYFTNTVIPLEMALDHLCTNKKCVNPNHLEIVTHAENCRRGIYESKEHLRNNRCKNGHLMTPENVYVYMNKGNPFLTHRVCKACIYLSHIKDGKKLKKFRANNPSLLEKLNER